MVPRAPARPWQTIDIRAGAHREQPSQQPLPDVESQPDLPALERAVLARWERDDTFRRSVDATRRRGSDGDNEFVFYDGPPFANGLPHYGHLLTGYVKDAVPRYQTMRGRRVERRFGWDCHGLPAEVQAEKELGISGHPEITAFGIDRFNDACRTSVLRYTEEWRDYVTRQARWVDFDNDYKTLDLDYMESVMWAFKTLWDKGLIYEGFRVLAYCWRCETPLSNTETRMDDVYRDRQDPALTVWFELDDGRAHPGLDDHAVDAAVEPRPRRRSRHRLRRDGGRRRRALRPRRVAARRRTPRSSRTPTQVGTIKGSELVGRRYTPLFDYFADTPNAFQVLAADFVSTEDGTGVVHMAPGFGEDDQIACNAAGIPTICPMDEHGRYTAEVRRLGRRARVRRQPARDPRTSRTAASSCATTRTTTRTRTAGAATQPLVYRAISSWFVEVTEFRDRMVELNQQITWVPEHVKDGSFGKWLANARDWSISRNRFWGSPIPVWKSDDPDYPRIDVYGSLAELERDFGVAVTDLHRPAVDELDAPQPRRPDRALDDAARAPRCSTAGSSRARCRSPRCTTRSRTPTGSSTTTRATSSSSTSAQTRGWFYTMHVLATALFDRPAFSQLRQPRHRARRRRPQDVEVAPATTPTRYAMFDAYGADAMRWIPAVVADPARRRLLGHRDRHPRHGAPRAPAVLERLLLPHAVRQRRRHHAVAFRTDQTDVLDRYLLAELRGLVDDGHRRSMDAYDLYGACESVAGVPRHADQLVHPPQPRPVLGRRSGRDRHAAHGARRRSARWRPRCCRS